MSDGAFRFPGPARVVLVDSSVLYSRVLRDYLLYASNQEVVTLA